MGIERRPGLQLSLSTDKGLELGSRANLAGSALEQRLRVGQSCCNAFGAPPKKKSDTVSTVSPSISHEVMGPDAMILVF